MSYDVDFYVQEGIVAAESAEVVAPWVLENYPVKSVIDVGCGTGAWANWFVALGCTGTGVDLDVPVKVRRPGYEFLVEDLINGYPCSGYDLAICLEVAEHLPPSTGPLLVAGLAQAPTVLFSAATPGQPGVGHINCCDHEYWHDQFAEHGMVPRYIGCLFQEPVASFYRRNMFIYTRTTP